MATENELRREQLASWKAARETKKGEERERAKSKSPPPPQSRVHRPSSSGRPKGTASGKEGRRKDKPNKSSNRSSGRRKKAEVESTEHATGANTVRTPMRNSSSSAAAGGGGGERKADAAVGRDARPAPPKATRSPTKVRQKQRESQPQDRTHVEADERRPPREEEYKGDPIMSPEPFQLFSPPTNSRQRGGAAAAAAASAAANRDDALSGGAVLDLVRGEIDRLADDAVDVDGSSTAEGGASSELRPPGDYTERIGRSLEIMGRRTDVMAEALERNYARTEALEKENLILREMCQRLVKSEHKDFMADMLSTVGSMKAALCASAGASAGAGAGAERGGGGGGRTVPAVSSGDEMVMDAFTGLDALIASAATTTSSSDVVEIPEDLFAASRETDGIKFVADLAEVMSIQTGHHGLLAGIMDRHLAMEAEEGDP